jgi:hypothetical protein
MYIPEPLGYTYGLAPAPAAAVAPAIMALGDKMKTLYATPNVSSAAGIKTFTAPNVQQAAATANKPLDIAVEIDRNLLAAVARRAPVGAGSELLDFNTARERAASGPRALAFIPEIAVTQHENTLYRVFIDCDYLSRLRQRGRAYRPHPDSNPAGAEQINRRSTRYGRAGARRSCVRLRLKSIGRCMCVGRRQWAISSHA